MNDIIIIITYIILEIFLCACIIFLIIHGSFVSNRKVDDPRTQEIFQFIQYILENELKRTEQEEKKKEIVESLEKIKQITKNDKV